MAELYRREKMSHPTLPITGTKYVRAPDAELAVRRWGIVEKSLSYGGMKADAPDLRNGAEELRERNCHSAAAILDALADALEEVAHDAR